MYSYITAWVFITIAIVWIELNSQNEKRKWTNFYLRQFRLSQNGIKNGEDGFIITPFRKCTKQQIPTVSFTFLTRLNVQYKDTWRLLFSIED